MGTTNENIDVDVRVWRVKEAANYAPLFHPYGALEISCECQTHSSVSNKCVSQALYQTLQTTKMNFEKLLG